MGPILNSLVDLQKIEIDLRKARTKLQRGRQRIKAQQQRIEQLNAAVKAKEEESKLAKLQYAKLELELRTDESEIAKLRLALNTAKTNKDYSAILTQINTDKADKAKLEDQLLQLLTQIETDQADKRELIQNLEVEDQKLAEISEQVAEKTATVQIDVDQLEAQYKTAAAHVPPTEQSLFKRLADRFDGAVLAEVSQMNGVRKEYSCGGCYMSVPLESVNSLMSKDDVLTCSNCGRILVLEMTSVT